eukprot:scaffold31072_cov60-Phaeocystis_antarctica.AAC.5
MRTVHKANQQVQKKVQKKANSVEGEPMQTIVSNRSSIPKGRGGHSSPYSRSGSSGVYTSSAVRVYNPAAYAATGAKTYTSSGELVSNPVAYAGATEASVRQNTISPKYLYHYTDSNSLNKISDSGHIKSSAGPGDCALGPGVCAHGMARTLPAQSMAIRRCASHAWQT